MPPPDVTRSGASVVIVHHVRDDRHAEYAAWLDEIGPVCRAWPGHLDWQLVRPIPGLTSTYTAIIRFDTPDHLRGWMESADRRRLVERVRPLLAADDTYTIRTGLDFWFASESAAPPVRWKQLLVTWSAIFPLVMLVPLAVAPALSAAGLPTQRWLVTLCGTGTICFLMTYVVMPRYTRLVRGWLYR